MHVLYFGTWGNVHTWKQFPENPSLLWFIHSTQLFHSLSRHAVIPFSFFFHSTIVSIYLIYQSIDEYVWKLGGKRGPWETISNQNWLIDSGRFQWEVSKIASAAQVDCIYGGWLQVTYDLVRRTPFWCNYPLKSGMMYCHSTRHLTISNH